MAHHKRKGPKSTRAGCLRCKPWKRQGAGGKFAAPSRPGVARQMQHTVAEGLESVEAPLAFFCDCPGCVPPRPTWADVLAMPAGCRYFGDIEAYAR